MRIEEVLVKIAIFDREDIVKMASGLRESIEKLDSAISRTKAEETRAFLFEAKTTIQIQLGFYKDLIKKMEEEEPAV
jgi:hypothetical protein